MCFFIFLCMEMFRLQRLEELPPTSLARLLFGMLLNGRILGEMLMFGISLSGMRTCFEDATSLTAFLPAPIYFQCVLQKKKIKKKKKTGYRDIPVHGSASQMYPDIKVSPLRRERRVSLRFARLHSQRRPAASCLDPTTSRPHPTTAGGPSPRACKAFQN
ncbi:hypothetical protein M5K25_020069 [Dendrobium thyrsiflorum]|uniref:Uncharacterized protein n=1 Tax=Dendrobium thyrsiflorum TaxID=117978 RepID=A0ABD0UG03_DENTH